MTGLSAMRAVLQQRRHLTAGVEAELEAGVAYWAAERRLCARMHAAPVVPEAGHAVEGLTEEAVLQASEGKSFDYRVRGGGAGGGDGRGRGHGRQHARRGCTSTRTGVRAAAQVLHHLLCSMRSEAPDPDIFAFLRVDEQLLDIGDGERQRGLARGRLAARISQPRGA